MKILIITYYWPPSGGAGVQRWLKLTKYLNLLNHEIHVITVKEEFASYFQLDQKLSLEIASEIKIHKTNSFEPIKIYSKLFGKSKVPVAGFSNVNNNSIFQKFINFTRSNFFIPDPRKGWNKFALSKAKEIIKEHNIRTVITTSPPHSTQLVGLKLKELFGPKINWFADLRDPWTDIYYYKLLQHSFISNALNKRLERIVLEKADKIVTVGEKFKQDFLNKSTKIFDEKISVITNGFDKDDFDNVVVNKDPEIFKVTYTGSMSDHYEPIVFFKALKSLILNYPNQKIQFEYYGKISSNLQDQIIKLIENHATFYNEVGHNEIIKIMKEANLLLLVTQGNDGTIPGKTFEYLATKNPILCIGKGDVEKFLEESWLGETFTRKEEQKIYKFLETTLINSINNIKPKVNLEFLEKCTRNYQASQFNDLF